MFGNGKPKTLTGLDIGSSSVKVVQLKHTKEGYEVVCAGMEVLPREAVKDGTIADAPAVAETINTVFEAQHMTLRDVAGSLSGHSVIVKRLTMPLMSEEELYDRIPAEAAQQIPFEVADVSLSYQLLGKTENDLDVLLVAARKDKIQNYTGAITLAGMEGRVMDVDAFALENCFEANYEPKASDLIALVNLGASVMNINITRGGAPLFTRDVAMGGKQFTEALQGELELSFEEAERLKTGSSYPGISDEQRDAVLRPVSEGLVLEIKKTFDFFRATTSGEEITCLYVAGGTAKLAGLLQMIRGELGLPVEELNPFRKVAIPAGQINETQLRDNAAQFAVAVGLGMREMVKS